MLRLLVLSLCMGCTGLAQQIPSCRMAIPVALAGRAGAELARDYRPGNLRVRVGDEPAGGDLVVARADHLVIVLDRRESMRPFWPAATQSLTDMLEQVDASDKLTLLLVGESLREIDGLNAARHFLEENSSADRLTGNMS